MNKTYLEVVARKRQEILYNGGISVQDVINLEGILSSTYGPGYESPILRDGLSTSSFTKTRSDVYHQRVLNALTNILSKAEIESIPNEVSFQRLFEVVSKQYEYVNYLYDMCKSLKKIDPAIVSMLDNVNHVEYDALNDKFNKLDTNQPLLKTIFETELKSVVIDNAKRSGALFQAEMLNDLTTNVLTIEDGLVVSVTAHDVAYLAMKYLATEKARLNNCIDNGEFQLAEVGALIKSIEHSTHNLTVAELKELIVLADEVEPLLKRLSYKIKMKLQANLFSSSALNAKLTEEYSVDADPTPLMINADYSIRLLF